MTFHHRSRGYNPTRMGLVKPLISSDFNNYLSCVFCIDYDADNRDFLHKETKRGGMPRKTELSERRKDVSMKMLNEMTMMSQVPLGGMRSMVPKQILTNFVKKRQEKERRYKLDKMEERDRISRS